MKKEKKLSLKVRDLTPSKDVVGGRHRVHGQHGHGFVQRGDRMGGLGPFGLRKIQ
jgi:hypothetical protein